MSVFKKLLQSRGIWQGTSKLWLSPQELARKLSSKLSLTLVIRGKFIEIN